MRSTRSLPVIALAFAARKDADFSGYLDKSGYTCLPAAGHNLLLREGRSP
jgi:hypothetical protein